MDIANIIQGGGTIATIGFMWFMIKYFIKVVETKDEKIEKSYQDFKAIITEHMVREESAFKELTNSIKEVIKK